MGKENQFYNLGTLLALCIEEPALQWILWHRSYFVLGSSLEIAFKPACPSSRARVKAGSGCV